MSLPYSGFYETITGYLVACGYQDENAWDGDDRYSVLLHTKRSDVPGGAKTLGEPGQAMCTKWNIISSQWDEVPQP